MRSRSAQPKSVGGPSDGTAGPSDGTVKALATENCRELSLSRDRNSHLQAIICPTTGTHIIYQMGCGAGDARDGTDTARHRLLTTQAPRLCTGTLLLYRYDWAAWVILSDFGSA